MNSHERFARGRPENALLPGLPTGPHRGTQVREVPITQSTLEGLPAGFALDRIVYQHGAMGPGLNVVVARDTTPGPPSTSRFQRLHRWRVGFKNVPVVSAVRRNDGQWWLHGPDADEPPVGPVADELTERLLSEALLERDGAAARSRITAFLESVTRGEGGVGNHGLFATHYLRAVLPDAPEWQDARERAGDWMHLRGKSLIDALGFSVHSVGTTAMLLTPKDAPARRRAIAVLLNDDERFEGRSVRFRVSPVALGLQVAQDYELSWLVALRGSQIRLYSALPGVGVGSRGQAETFFELDLALLPLQQAAYLDLAFSEAALRPQGTVGAIIAGSKRYATALGERLRQRIYQKAVPGLAVAVAGELQRIRDANAADLEYAYRVTLRILFRLLFQAYAEDRNLLPYGRNKRYDSISLKRRAEDLAQRPEMRFDSQSSTVWRELRTVWAAIDTGDIGLDVPPYNGGLFGSRRDLHPEGAAIERITLDDQVVGHALRHLLVDISPDGVLGAIDFRDLTIREFGTIYEGLIGSTLSRAVTDLARDDNGNYVPAAADDTVVVKQGQPYFHDATQARKATGTYFTPEFAVRHLLERALDPALDDHLERVRSSLATGDEATAAERFFDFRVADIAMGSGHFLVGAIDHIESKMSAFLAEHSIPAVTDELRRLEESARKALGLSATGFPIETAALLRRQIARRCVYGVDISPIGVDLARVAVWLHTFVPGLPMSTLDHNLVCGNSLTGIDRIETALALLDPACSANQLSIFSAPIQDALKTAKVRLLDAAKAAEANKAEVERSAEALYEAMRDAEPARLLFNAATAVRAGKVALPDAPSVEELTDLARDVDVTDVTAELEPAHFPFLFPEVFLRDNGGFDVILGNPPWEKVKVEKKVWWGSFLPGVRSMPVGKMNTLIRQLQVQRPDLESDFGVAVGAAKRLARYLKATFPRLGAGDTDLFQAFAWRFWELLRSSGYIGVVMPRSALSGSALAEWRRLVLGAGRFDEVTTLINTGHWAFPDIHGQYAVSLTTVRKGREHSGAVGLRGPFHSLREYECEIEQAPVQVPTEEFKSWSANASFPSLPTPESLGIFRKMYEHPLFGKIKQASKQASKCKIRASLSSDSRAARNPRQASVRSGRRGFRPHREFDAAKDKDRFVLDDGRGAMTEIRFWPVYKGASFDLWTPETGTYYASADSEAITDHLHHKRLNQAKNRRSSFCGMPKELLADADTLPCRSARIAFRDVARATDSRTVRCALIPPDRVITHQAPYLVRYGDAQEEAFLLGVMSSIPFDWCARRIVELHLTFTVLNRLPVPQPDRSSSLRHRIVELAGRLAAHDNRFANWATEVGVPVGSLRNEPERSEAIYEIDALVAHLYGLNSDDLTHVFETFHRGWDYEVRLEAVLGHHRLWEGNS